MAVLIPALLAVLAAAPVGCGGDLSNQVFFEDAEFLAALPTREVFQVHYVDDFEDTPGIARDVLLFDQTLSALGAADLYLELATSITDALRTLTPAVRGEDYRSWGPSDYSFGAGLEGYLQVEMTRSVSGGGYTYSFYWSASPSGPWTRFFIGHHYIGDTVEDGSGSMVWDYGALLGAGTLTIEYDLRDSLALYVALDALRLTGQDEVYDADWYYVRGDDGGGDFEYTAATDIGGAGDESGEPILEWMEIRSRWTASGDGRGDALLSGGDLLGEAEGRITQCWTVDGQLTAQRAEPEPFESALPDQGDPAADCPYPDTAEVENLHSR